MAESSPTFLVPTLNIPAPEADLQDATSEIESAETEVQPDGSASQTAVMAGIEASEEALGQGWEQIPVADADGAFNIGPSDQLLMPPGVTEEDILGPGALAQDADIVDDGTLEQIFVTARKRGELLQDVPFSLAAQTEEKIRNSGAQNLEELSYNVAGFTVQNLGPGQSQVAIRGVAAGQIVRDQPGVKEQVEAVRAIAEDLGAGEFQWAVKPEERTRLWQARHDAAYAAKALKPGGRILATDVCVPISRLCDRLARRALEMGGTCTGEHGVGMGKMKYMRAEHGDAVDVMRMIKQAIDPENLMNPGKMLPPS